MNVRNYFATVMPLSEEDGGGFVAYLPDLPGCMGDGETPEAALEDAYSAAEAWLDTNLERGRDTPVPFSAIEDARDRQAALIKALQTALSMLGESEGKISDLERQVHHLIALMRDDRKTMSLTAIANSAVKKKTICH